MGLKCSVFGHRFEEPGLVNEREQRGEEVINIKRKVMVCTICGDQRVLAERKEITNNTSREVSDVGTADDEDGSVTVETDDSVGSEAEESGLAGVDVVNGETTATESEPATPHTDDGVILAETSYPSTKDAKESTSETIDAAADDGEIIASSPESSASTETRASPDRANSSEIMDEVLSCSSCGFSVLASDSPFRSGDSCPRCHEAYLSETDTNKKSVTGGQSAE